LAIISIDRTKVMTKFEELEFNGLHTFVSRVC
jgi:hypothetical protein